MDERIIAIYCLCDDCLKALHHIQDPQCTMGDAEVMTTAIVAAVFFRGNFEAARAYLSTHQFIPTMLSKSRFNRRLHRIGDLFLMLFAMLGEMWKELNAQSIYSIDSFPNLQHHFRKRIETVGSLIERLLPKSIHAVTPRGFELKVVLFVLAVSINCL